MSIELMLKNCKTEIELRQFAEAQGKTLQSIMKKNREQAEEIEHLKKLVVNGAIPIVSEGKSPIQIGTDSEEIAKIEINKLKMRAMDSESLMLEEAKKLEIYTKILLSSSKPEVNKLEREVKEMGSDSLLAFIEAPEDK